MTMPISQFPSETSASPLSSSSPVFSFLTLPTTVYTCGSLSIAWNYSGGPADANPFPLVITNNQVSQIPNGAPPSGSSVPVQSVNETIVQVNPLIESYTWYKVDVAPGRYNIVAFMSPSPIRSNDFSVVNGTDTSCLPNPTNPVSSVSATSSQQSPSSSISPSPVQLSTSKSSNVGKIAGGVVGGLVAVAIILAFLFLLWRRLSAGKGSTQWASAKGRPRSFTKVISPTTSTGSILPSNAVPANIPSDMSHTPPSSQEDIPMSIEKGFFYNDMIAPLPAHVRHASASSSLKSKGRARSMSSNAIYGNFDVPLQQRSNSNRRSIDSTSFALHRQSDMSLATPLSSDARFDRSSSGRRASRKPVPTYDVADFNASNSSSDASSRKIHPTKSFSSLKEQGERTVHYLIPDAPLPERD